LQPAGKAKHLNWTKKLNYAREEERDVGWVLRFVIKSRLGGAARNIFLFVIDS